MKLTKEKLLIYLAAASALVLVISNICAVKLWDLGGIAVDGGLVLFPLSYILGDVTVEIFGKKQSRSIILASFVANIIAVITFYTVGLLPEYPGWGGQEAYDTILGFVPRIVAGSLLGYLASQFLNNYVFEIIRKKTGTKWLGVRTIGSSLLAHVVDTAIFETVAFLGVLSFGEFLAQAGLAYVMGVGLEIILTPITYLVIGLIRKNVNIEKIRG